MPKRSKTKSKPKGSRALVRGLSERLNFVGSGVVGYRIQRERILAFLLNEFSASSLDKREGRKPDGEALRKAGGPLVGELLTVADSVIEKVGAVLPLVDAMRT